ncbi:MAG: 6-phosphogluconolactonase, partial [Alphaproteobacteria bacterium]|nr:6-phosphogluconolactonase [Alphaproteobacteria bacterium]
MSGIAGTMEVLKDAGALAARAADIIAGRMKVVRYPFRLVLSGGSTPRATYELLAKKDLSWDCAEIFFSDERFVPPDHKDSNYRMVRESLLSSPSVNPRKLLAIPTDGTLQSAADRYDEVLRQQYGAGTLEASVPLFHLTLLGLGDDGHTASLLPGQPILKEMDLWAAAVPQGRGEPRVSLTYPAINSSELILFLVSGAGKRDALAQARGGIGPAGGIKPQGEVLWLADEVAAGAE